MEDKQYEMIGGDGELYGPFTIQQLQDNLSHGRANAQTKIRETGTARAADAIDIRLGIIKD